MYLHIFGECCITKDAEIPLEWNVDSFRQCTLHFLRCQPGDPAYPAVARVARIIDFGCDQFWERAGA